MEHADSEPCVLIADGDAFGREALRAYLEMLGHTIIEAADGAEAMILVKTAEPHVMVSGLRLQGVDSYTLAQRIRAELRPEYRPFLIAFTGSMWEVDHDR
jgi:CheY-like chemotaxis protein